MRKLSEDIRRMQAARGSVTIWFEGWAQRAEELEAQVAALDKGIAGMQAALSAVGKAHRDFADRLLRGDIPGPPFDQGSVDEVARRLEVVAQKCEEEAEWIPMAYQTALAAADREAAAANTAPQEPQP